MASRRRRRCTRRLFLLPSGSLLLLAAKNISISRPDDAAGWTDASRSRASTHSSLLDVLLRVKRFRGRNRKQALFRMSARSRIRLLPDDDGSRTVERQRRRHLSRAGPQRPGPAATRMEATSSDFRLLPPGIAGPHQSGPLATARLPPLLQPDNDVSARLGRPQSLRPPPVQQQQQQRRLFSTAPAILCRLATTSSIS